MAGSFSRIYVQYVFAVKGRQNLLQKPWRDEVFRYMAGIIKGKDQKPIIVNEVADHVHVFVGLKPAQNISGLIRDIKKNTWNFINEQHWVKGKFRWQEGYGAFSYTHSQITAVFEYIQNQEWYHRTKTFREEYVDFFKKLKLNMKRNICLIGWKTDMIQMDDDKRYMSPLRNSGWNNIIMLKSLHPFGISQ